MMIIPANSTLEIFTLAAEHLLAQGKRSTASNSDSCVYRGANGLMCGAGPAIPDDKYVYKMEGNNFLSVNNDFDLGYSEIQVDVLLSIQRVHDGHQPPEWKERLTNLFHLMKQNTAYYKFPRDAELPSCLVSS